MDLSKIKELLKIVAESDVSEVEFEEDDFKVVVRKHSPTVTVQPPVYNPSFGFQTGYPPPVPQAYQFAVPQPAAPPAAAAEPYAPPPAPNAPEPETPAAAANQTTVKAPIVGTFYRRPSPDDAPFVDVGDTIKPGDVLCIIEAMKLMNEIESEVSGTIVKVLVEDGQPVEFDQDLFVVEN